MRTPVVNEKTTATYACSFTDALKATITKASVVTLKATLRDVSSNQIINSRSAQTVLDANGGTMTSDGAFTLVLSDADNVVVSGSGTNQMRRLTLEMTYTSGRLTHEYVYVVKSLDDIS